MGLILILCTVIYLYNLYTYNLYTCIMCAYHCMQSRYRFLYMCKMSIAFEAVNDDSNNIFPWYGMYWYISARQTNMDLHIRFT